MKMIPDRFCCAALLVAIVGCSSDLCLGQTLSDLKTCQDFANANPDNGIRACSIFIRTHRSVGGRAALPIEALRSMYGLRAIFYLRKGDQEQAFEDIDRRIAIDPNGFAAYQLRGMWEFVHHNYRDALKDFTSWLDRAKTDSARAEVLKRRAEIYQLMGDDERARADYARAGDLVPSLRESIEQLRELDARWISYLKGIEEDGDYANWSGPPWTLFRENIEVLPQSDHLPAQADVQRTSDDSVCAAAGLHWRSAEAIGTLAVFEDHLARFPGCPFAGLARARIEALRTQPDHDRTRGTVH